MSSREIEKRVHEIIQQIEELDQILKQQESYAFIDLKSVKRISCMHFKDGIDLSFQIGS